MRFYAFSALFAAALLLLPHQSVAQNNPTPPSTGPITNCSNGCTIITCNATTCTVHYCNYSGCREVSTYPRPDETRNVVGSSVTRSKSIHSTTGTDKLSDTTAPVQFATACAKSGLACRMWVVKPEGSALLGYYER